ncbi:MAG: hypothetical protein JWL94_1754 [Microbacteriaceae bacterium]|jgi:hypothetical protein|nr:hypothetical protein [Microbacteriaceae bacterium]HEV7957548.1 hypothetical protein [Marisediminicola sp.]
MTGMDGLNERESLEKDTHYSPRSDTDTGAKQDASVSSSAAMQDDDVDASQVDVLPGTGGPDDVGDVDVDESDLNLSGDSIPGHPKPAAGS